MVGVSFRFTFTVWALLFEFYGHVWVCIAVRTKLHHPITLACKFMLVAWKVHRDLNHLSSWHFKLSPLYIYIMAAAVFNPRGDLGATCGVRIGVCTRKDGIAPPHHSCLHIHLGSMQCAQRLNYLSSCHFHLNPPHISWLQHFPASRVIFVLCGTCMGVWSRKDGIVPTHSCLHIHDGSIVVLLWDMCGCV